MASDTQSRQPEHVTRINELKKEIRRIRQETTSQQEALRQQITDANAAAHIARKRTAHLERLVAPFGLEGEANRWAEVRLESIVPVRQPLVLISQIQRAGGTLMARLFDDHAACFAHPYELKWGRPEKWDWPSLDLAGSPEEWALLLKENWSDEFAASGVYQKHSARLKGGVAQDLERQPFIFSPKLQLAIFERLLPGPGAPDQRAILDAHLTSLFNAWLDYQNLYRGPKRFVTAFTPRVNMFAAGRAGLRRDYPDGYLITIVREPLSWLASALGHPHPDFKDVDRAVDLWRQSLQGSIDAWQEDPERTIVVLFEDVVRRTEETMRSVASRLGLEWSPSLCVPTYNSRPVASDSSFVPSREIDGSATRRRLSLDEPTIRSVKSRTLKVYEQARRQFALPH